MRGSGMMNIYDIAKLAGVSIATVSRVVNDSPKVSAKTGEKVRRIMEENNYTPCLKNWASLILTVII